MNLFASRLKILFIHGWPQIWGHVQIKALIEKSGTKIKNYYKSDEHVFVLIKMSETGKGKNKRIHRMFLKFNHNVKPSEEESVEE